MEISERDLSLEDLTVVSPTATFEFVASCSVALSLELSLGILGSIKLSRAAVTNRLVLYTSRAIAIKRGRVYHGVRASRELIVIPERVVSA